jgi:hypothetical protein
MCVCVCVCVCVWVCGCVGVCVCKTSACIQQSAAECSRNTKAYTYIRIYIHTYLHTYIHINIYMIYICIICFIYYIYKYTGFRAEMSTWTNEFRVLFAKPGDLPPQVPSSRPYAMSV